MSTYTCPNCSTKLTSNDPVPAGKKIKCRACDTVFAPAGDAAKAAPAAAGHMSPAQQAAAAAYSDDNSPYLVTHEEETEEQKKARKKVNFAGTEAKFTKSARGPAIALLIMPSNLLVASGALTIVGGIIVFLFGMWPVVFTEIAATEEEWADQAVIMLFGVMLIAWGVLVCAGASKMQNLESYTWSMVGAVLGMVPLLVGLFALVMLRNPRVIAGFEEMEGAAEEDEDDDGDDDDDEEDDEDEDDD